MSAIRDAFPGADFVALPEVIEVIRRLLPTEYATWKPKYGDEIPDSPLIPEPLRGNTLELEGSRMEIASGQGDVEGSSFVWIPALKAVVTWNL